MSAKGPNKGKAAVHCVPKGRKCPKGWRMGGINTARKIGGKKRMLGFKACRKAPFAVKRASACTSKPNLAGVPMSAKVLRSKVVRVQPKGFHVNRSCPYWVDSKARAVLGPRGKGKALSKKQRDAIRRMKKRMKKATKPRFKTRKKR